jgi:hypothetical protein
MGIEREEVPGFGFLDRLRAGLDPRFAGKLTFRLQQTQLASANDSFGATLDL